MRSVFFGSPEFAVPCLEALHEVSDVRAVIAQPDRPAGRGLALRQPAVKVRALELGLDVWQPKKVRTEEFAERLRALGADVGVVVAYGRILPRAVLDAPRAGCVNVHASLLPRWRGAAPIQWAIVHGDAETGVTLMQMDEGMDTGPILAASRTEIRPDEDAQALAERLAGLGASLLQEQLHRYAGGELSPVPQDGSRATMAPLLRKEDGRIDWDQSAKRIVDRIRGMNPWPGATARLGDRVVKIHRARTSTLDPEGVTPGEVLAVDATGVFVACREGAVVLETVQESGRKRVDARSFVAGRGVQVGDRFESEGTER